MDQTCLRRISWSTAPILTILQPLESPESQLSIGCKVVEIGAVDREIQPKQVWQEKNATFTGKTQGSGSTGEGMHESQTLQANLFSL